MKIKGINDTGNDDGILVLGATDIQWVLDSAIRRRLEKKFTLVHPKNTPE